MECGEQEMHWCLVRTQRKCEVTVMSLLKSWLVLRGFNGWICVSIQLSMIHLICKNWLENPAKTSSNSL
jgi:hypothetical protein